MDNTSKNLEFINRATELALVGMDSSAGGPFGAVIVKDSKIIAEGYNCVTSKKDPTLHAEIVALRKACEVLDDFNLRGCVIYTSCEPCPMCLGALYWAQIDKIYYANTRDDAHRIGFSDRFLYEELCLANKDRKIPIYRLNTESAIEAFEKWVKKEDKISY